MFLGHFRMRERVTCVVGQCEFTEISNLLSCSDANPWLDSLGFEDYCTITKIGNVVKRLEKMIKLGKEGQRERRSSVKLWSK